MKKYLGRKVGDVVSNGLEKYTITSIDRDYSGVHFSLKGVNVSRSITIHERVMKLYPTAPQNNVDAKNNNQKE